MFITSIIIFITSIFYYIYINHILGQWIHWTNNAEAPLVHSSWYNDVELTMWKYLFTIVNSSRTNLWLFKTIHRSYSKTHINGKMRLYRAFYRRWLVIGTTWKSRKEMCVDTISSFAPVARVICIVYCAILLIITLKRGLVHLLGQNFEVALQRNLFELFNVICYSWSGCYCNEKFFRIRNCISSSFSSVVTISQI